MSPALTKTPSTAQAIRLASRSTELKTPTFALAPGHIQANLLIIPSSAAPSFRALCARNPVPCPLLGESLRTGDFSTFTSAIGPALFASNADVDVRRDLPKYNIYRNGELLGTRDDVVEEWTDDHVAFLIGCSFSFESALQRANLIPRHWTQCCNVPMYKTNWKLCPAGLFTDGEYVVSMRPYRPEDVEEVRRITRPFGAMHGEPIAWGWEAVKELGIGDLEKPDFGNAVRVEEGEVPIFWGCGVTPQAAVIAAGSKVEGVVMAHAPGHMMILDLTEDEMACQPK